jgi:hypothetical protein
MAYDMAVVNLAYSTARGMGASDKVLLALFEAAIVESGFRNLSYGDRDSVGFLQQRPSQGWSNPMDVATATRSFVSKAMPLESKYSTSGQLAQAVQRSAFPLKYDAVRGQASVLLTQVRGSATVDAQDVGLGASGNLDKVLTTLTDPGTWKRLGIWMLGGILILVALIQISGTGRVVRSAAKTAVGFVPGGSVVAKAAKVVKK